MVSWPGYSNATVQNSPQSSPRGALCQGVESASFRHCDMATTAERRWYVHRVPHRSLCSFLLTSGESKRDAVPMASYPPLDGTLCFGGDYNPEQWSSDVWREDVALMREAGV